MAAGTITHGNDDEACVRLCTTRMLRAGMHSASPGGRISKHDIIRSPCIPSGATLVAIHMKSKCFIWESVQMDSPTMPEWFRHVCVRFVTKVRTPDMAQNMPIPKHESQHLEQIIPELSKLMPDGVGVHVVTLSTEHHWRPSIWCVYEVQCSK